MKITHYSLLYSTLLFGQCLAAPAPPSLLHRDNDNADSDSLLSPETHQAIEALLLQTNVPGMPVVLTTPDKDEILSFGNETIFGDPVTNETWWSIASNSKLFTSVLLAMLSEDEIPLSNGGVYQLDTPLIDFMPDFEMYDDNATQHATTLDFLSHSTGLPTHNYAINSTITTKDWFYLLPHLPPTAPFRSLFQYSNLNYAAAAYIAEYLTGRDFYELVTERVILPAGLTVGADGDATYDLSEAIASGHYANGFINMGVNATECAIDTAAAANDTNTTGADTPAGPSPASCYGRLEAFESWARSDKGHEYGGGGGINLNGKGILQWLRAMTHAEGIPQNIIDIVDTPRFPANEAEQYNMGSYTVQTGSNETLKYHGGSLFSHFSLFGRVPERGVGTFVISNSVYHSSAANAAVWGLILDELLPSGEAAPDGGEPQEEGSGDEGQETTTPPAAAAEYPPLPADPRPSPTPQEEWADKEYSHPGYGQFTLSLLNMSDSSALEAAGIPPQFIATDLISGDATGDFARMYSGNVLYAHYGHLVAEHLVFTHFDGPLYNFTVINTFPSLDVQPGEDTRVGQLLGQGPALFEDGKIGMYTWILGDQTLPQVMPEEGNVDGAEIIFASA